MSYERTFIGYISQVLNIKIENDFVVDDIKTELTTISKLSDEAIIEFRKYIKENLKHVELDYLTGFQKFIKLAEMFKCLYKDKIAQDIDLKARSLSLKLRTSLNSHTKENLLNPAFKFDFLKQNRKSYFNKRELYILNRVEKERIYGLLSYPYLLEKMLLNIYKEEAQKVFKKKLQDKSKQSKLVEDLTNLDGFRRF